LSTFTLKRANYAYFKNNNTLFVGKWSFYTLHSEDCGGNSGMLTLKVFEIINFMSLS